ncbi:dihydropteroate synthase [Salinimonas sp. HHU 13199]|uniref:Dihydropteroate synthase n=1 Tax=Salinimonas profundi TaxID=2729140 RepID=A0ABR8LHG2_9ALTE|nr:dihydropteroate synthase [Salinimonas profundi]MBD3584638.1 dihydropteroate synthase [Salinimonas profundi]
MNFKNQTVDLTRPVVMGIINTTPDSFSDGGRFNSVDAAIDRCAAMVQAGAAFIDVGGESTRPGAPLVSFDEELERVIPVIEALSDRFDTVVSVDTSKPQVMRQAVSAGAALINDVRALQEPGALDAAAECNVPVCLMHMQGAPETMQNAPSYNDVISDVQAFLSARIAACSDAGIHKSNIILDPGFGFGKTLAHNYQLLAGLGRLQEMGYPLLVGMSRKSMVGNVLNNSINERLAGSLALATIAAQAGAQIIRVHDVQETVDVIAIVNAYRDYTLKGE